MKTAPDDRYFADSLLLFVLALAILGTAVIVR